MLNLPSHALTERVDGVTYICAHSFFVKTGFKTIALVEVWGPP